MTQRKDGNTMKQNDILDSIGGISDSIIDEAVDYVPKSKSVKRLSVKMLSAISAAAVLCIALTVTCFANATEISAVISSLFRREQEYIDPYAQIINKSDTENNINMTVRKVTKDGDNYILYLSLQNETEDFAAGYLTFDSISLDYKSDGKTLNYTKLVPQVTSTDEDIKGVLTSAILEFIYKPTREINIHLTIPAGSNSEDGEKYDRCRDWESGKCHFEINGLSVIPYSIAENGNFEFQDENIYYADKLEVDFDYDVDEVKKLPETVLYPDSDFELGGTNFRITKIVHTATSLKVTIEDMDKKLLEYGDLHFWGTAKIAGFISPEEYPWLPKIDDTGEKVGFISGFVKDGVLDLEAEREFWKKMSSVKKEYKLYDTIYVPYIVFSTGAKQECAVIDCKYDLWPLNPDGTLNMNVYEQTFYFDNATSLDDIQGIEFLSWDYDYSGETPEPKTLRSRITGWIN